MATVISLFSKKGGVGKTTTTFNLAGHLAEKGQRVLMVDADHQASLSQGILTSEVVERLRMESTVSALFDEVHEPEPEEIICSTACERVFLAPASDLLQPRAHPEPRQHGDLQFAFRDFVSEVGGAFDFIIFDTPPDCANLLSWNCLMASDYVLSLVKLEPLSVQSIAGVIRKLDEACSHGNPQLQCLGYVASMRKKRCSLHEAYEKKLRQLYGTQVFQNVIYDWIAMQRPHTRRCISVSTFCSTPNTDLKGNGSSISLGSPT